MSKFELFVQLVHTLVKATGRTSLPIYYVNSSGFVRIYVTKFE